MASVLLSKAENLKEKSLHFTLTNEKFTLVLALYICGAKNFTVGDFVPYAPLGTRLIDFTVKKAKIRGVESCGVLCAEDEIGFGEDHSGLMLLSKKEKLGKPLAEIYPEQLD